MANSSENTKSAVNTADEFQDALEDSETTAIESAETINDQDAIDRLLMDNAFDSPADEDEFAEIDELINGGLAEPANDRISDMDEAFDEFADVQPEQPTTDENARHSAPTDTALLRPEPEAEHQNADELAGAIADNAEEGKAKADTNLYATELDISDEAEDDVVVDADDDNEAISALPEATQEQRDETDSQQTVQAAGFSNELAAVSTQLSTLKNGQEQFTSQVNAHNAQLSAFAEELEGHNAEQKKLQRRLSLLEKKLPAALVYSGVVIASIALMTAVGLFIFSFAIDSRTTELSSALRDLDDKVNAWLNNNSRMDQLNDLNSRHAQLNQTVEKNSAQLAGIVSQLEKLVDSKKDDSISHKINQLNESQLQTAAVVESLQRKIDRLEKSKRVAFKPSRKKSVVVKQNWVVNLIAFRQSWYAQRKALEYEKKGVPAVVKAVVVADENWYRLLVKGFATKAEAAVYAGKVKKALNLTSVWIAKE